MGFLTPSPASDSVCIIIVERFIKDKSLIKSIINKWSVNNVRKDINALIDEDNERISMSQFSEHAAKRMYQLTCEPKAYEYLRQIVPPKPEKSESFGRSNSKTSNSLDLSELASFL